MLKNPGLVCHLLSDKRHYRRVAKQIQVQVAPLLVITSAEEVPVVMFFQCLPLIPECHNYNLILRPDTNKVGRQWEWTSHNNIHNLELLKITFGGDLYGLKKRVISYQLTQNWNIFRNAFHDTNICICTADVACKCRSVCVMMNPTANQCLHVCSRFT